MGKSLDDDDMTKEEEEEEEEEDGERRRRRRRRLRWSRMMGKSRRVRGGKQARQPGGDCL